MLSKSAITKLQAILIIDLLVVAFAAGAYYYLRPQFESTAAHPLLKPAEFQVTDLTLYPLEAGVGQPIIISVNVTNVGEQAGDYVVDLIINDVLEQNKTVQLPGGATTAVEFTVTEANVGTYTVKLGTLTGAFNIVASPTTGRSAAISAHDLVISPSEAWPGESIKISAQFTNYGDATGHTVVNLRINGETKNSRTIDLSGGATTAVEFTVTEANVGTYTVQLSTLTGAFSIVPSGMHTLSVRKNGADADFTIDGRSCRTPYSALWSVGKHTIVMPPTDPTGQYIFLNWEDHSTNPTRTINLVGPMSLFAYYSGGSSCPSLYIWNGTSYVYVSDVSNHGWLGYIKYINEDGSITFWRNNPWDYIPLDKSQLQTSNGYYNLTLLQRYDEIFYLDSAYMLVVDHPPNVNVYSTMVEEYLDPNYMGKIYTVTKNPLTPISAFNEKGEDILPQISKIDGIFTPGINGLNSQSWDNISWNRLTLDLGNLAGAKQIKLIVRAIVDWGSPNDYSKWLASFFAQPVPNGTQVTPPPYMEVKDANGNWIRVPEGREFPIPPDGVPRTFVVDLTGLFPTNDYSLRISNFWNVTFDYIGIDTTPQENVTIQRIDPCASLYQAFKTNSISAGNFTRYGDVTQLVLNADDEFVIGRQGDAVSLRFLAANIAPPPENTERDFFFFVSCWFKDVNGNWGFGFGFTVDPLPFHDMGGFPYPLTESYPYDAKHLRYLSEYNTRTISAP